MSLVDGTCIVRALKAGLFTGEWSPRAEFGENLEADFRAEFGCFTDAALSLSGASQWASRASEAALVCDDISFTICAWVKVDSFATYNMIVAKGIGTAAETEYELRVDPGGIPAFLATYDANTVFTANPPAPLVEEEWAFIEAGYDKPNARLFIRVNNGAAYTQANPGAALRAANPSAFYIGARGGSGPFPMHGSVCRVGLWKRLFTDAERTWLYNGGAGRFAAEYGLVEPEGTNLLTSIVDGWDAAEKTGVISGRINGLDLSRTNDPSVEDGPGEGACVDRSPCKRIEDQSGNAVHLLQPTIANQALWIEDGQNGRPVLRSDGLASYYTTAGNFTLAQPLAWFAAFKYISGAGSAGAALYGLNGNAPAVYRRGDDLFSAFAASEQSAGPSDTEWHTHSVVFNGAASAYYLDGAGNTLAGNPGPMGYGAGTATPGPLTMFGNSSPGFLIAVDMARAFLVSVAPSAGQIDSARTYLKALYATP